MHFARSLALAMAVLALAGCSTSAPTSTPTSTPETPPKIVQTPEGVGVFGAYYIDIDPAAATAELSPSREAAAFGDSWWLNATGFLDNRPCAECLSLEGISRDPAGIKLALRVRHPFAPGDPGLPVSATNRLDLHVFDAQLQVAGDLNPQQFAFTGVTESVSTKLVVNPTGYSGLLEPVVRQLLPGTSGTVYPYIAWNVDRTAGNADPSSPTGFTDVRNPSGYNVFPMGADVPGEIVLGLTPADGPTRVLVLFTCSYGQSAVGRAQRLTPRYPLPEYNAKAASRLDTGCPILSGRLVEGNTGSSTVVEARVWDWQAASTVDPDLTSYDSIKAPSAPSSVTVVIPGILNTPLDLGAPVSGTGAFDDPLLYSGLILNQANASAGTYVGASRVLDSRSPGLNAGGSPDSLSSPDGIALDQVQVEEFATYQTFTVEVDPPVALHNLLSIDITPTARQIIDQGPSGAVTFTAIGTYDTPPLTEDITSTVTWQSSAVDVATFGTNLLTGVGMGTTTVTATLSSITSPPTAVIVKPVEFSSLLLSFPQGVDADQTNGTVYVAISGAVNKYSDDGTFLSTFPTNFTARGVTFDETSGNLFGYEANGNPRVWVYNGASGAQVTTYPLPNAGCGPNGMHITSNGQLWSTGFCGTPFDLARYDPANGTLINGWDHPSFAAQIGIDGKDGLLAVANPGNRPNFGLIIADQASQTVLANASVSPGPVYSQNSYVAIDRDGFMHMEWQGDSGSNTPSIIQVYEYIAPSTLNLLYTYSPSDTGAWISTGLAVSRPGNVVVFDVWDIFGGQYRSVWFH